jgi:hypothetical protein
LTHYQMCDLMPSEQYHYLQTRLPPENSDMDNVKTENLAYLVATAQTLVDSNSGALLALCERLKG